MKRRKSKFFIKFSIFFLLLIFAVAAFFLVRLTFTGFAPLDDYALYDDFTDTNYEASSSLQTIQIDVCKPNSCGGIPDGIDEYGCQKWKKTTPAKTVQCGGESPRVCGTVKCPCTSGCDCSYIMPCFGSPIKLCQAWYDYGSSGWYSAGSSSWGCRICKKNIPTKYEYCGGSSGGETGSGQTINLPEDTTLVVIIPELPDNNQHSFTVNGKTITVVKQGIGAYYSEKGISPYDPSVITFMLSDYENRKLNFGSNTIKTDIPLTVYIQTGSCENYVSSRVCGGYILPDGVDLMQSRCKSGLPYGGDDVRRHLKCYYPLWNGREELTEWYQIPYGGFHGVIITPAEFKPSLGRISFTGDISAKDFKNSDIKIKYNGKLGVDIVELKENVFYQKVENSVSLPTLASTTQDHIVEIKHSKITPGELHIYNDGMHIGNIIADFDNFHLKLHSQISVEWYSVSWSSTRNYNKPRPSVDGKTDYVKFKIPFNCKVFEDEYLVYEDYYPGETIKLDENFSLSEDGCEVMKFCLSHPTVLSEQSGSTRDDENEVYQALVKGNSLTVPADQTWKVIFIAKQSDQGKCRQYTPTFINETYVKELELKLSEQEEQILSLETSISEKADLLNALKASLDEKNNLILALELSLGEKAELINALNSSLAEKASLVTALQLSLAEKVELINALKYSIEEKAGLIKSLEASLLEKAALIDALKLSSDEKAKLIEALQYSITEKESLINALQLSLSEKAELINSLSASLAEKASLINALQLSLSEKTSLIKSLELSISEKAELLNALQLSLSEKVSLIDSLSASMTEKAELINALQLSIQEKNQLIEMSDSDSIEKAQLIEALSTNLAEKVALVNALRASLAEKASLIDSLQISLQEKASLVNSLDLSLKEKSSLIDSLKLSLDEKAELVNSLQLSLQEKQSLVNSLKLSLAEKAELINALDASLAEKASLIESLKLSLDEKAKLIDALKYSLQEKAELINSLEASLNEKAALISALDLSLKEKAELINSLSLSLAEKASLINALKLSSQEKEELIEALNASLAEKEALIKGRSFIYNWGWWLVGILAFFLILALIALATSKPKRRKRR